MISRQLSVLLKVFKKTIECCRHVWRHWSESRPQRCNSMGKSCIVRQSYSNSLSSDSLWRRRWLWLRSFGSDTYWQQAWRMSNFGRSHRMTSAEGRIFTDQLIPSCSFATLAASVAALPTKTLPFPTCSAGFDIWIKTPATYRIKIERSRDRLYPSIRIVVTNALQSGPLSQFRVARPYRTNDSSWKSVSICRQRGIIKSIWKTEPSLQG